MTACVIARVQCAFLPTGLKLQLDTADVAAKMARDHKQDLLAELGESMVHLQQARDDYELALKENARLQRQLEQLDRSYDRLSNRLGSTIEQNRMLQAVANAVMAQRRLTGNRTLHGGVLHALDSLESQ
jgi:uncharacterized protein (DUF3084 family)